MADPITGVLAREIEMWPVDKPITWPGNPRRGNLKSITESIETNGFYSAIGVQRSTGYVIYGNHRLIAAREMKMSEVPVIVLDVDDEQARRMVLADNKTSDDGTYNTDDLVSLLGEFDLDDLIGTGWTAEEVDKLLTPEGDFEPDADPQMGDLEFRIVVDCRSESHQAELLATFEREGLTARPLVS